MLWPSTAMVTGSLIWWPKAGCVASFKFILFEYFHPVFRFHMRVDRGFRAGIFVCWYYCYVHILFLPKWCIYPLLNIFMKFELNLVILQMKKSWFIYDFRCTRRYKSTKNLLRHQKTCTGVPPPNVKPTWRKDASDGRYYCTFQVNLI